MVKFPTLSNGLQQLSGILPNISTGDLLASNPVFKLSSNGFLVTAKVIYYAILIIVFLVVCFFVILMVSTIIKSARQSNIFLSLLRKRLNNKDTLNQYFIEYYNDVFSCIESLFLSAITLNITGVSTLDGFKLNPPTKISWLDKKEDDTNISFEYENNIHWKQKKRDYSSFFSNLADFQAPFINLLPIESNNIEKLLVSSNINELIKGVRQSLLLKSGSISFNKENYFNPIDLLRNCALVEADLFIFARGMMSMSNIRSISRNIDGFLLGYLYAMEYITDRTLFNFIKNKNKWLTVFLELEDMFVDKNWNTSQQARFFDRNNFTVFPEEHTSKIFKLFSHFNLSYNPVNTSDRRIPDVLEEINNKFFVPLLQLLNGRFSWHPIPKDKYNHLRGYNPNSNTSYANYGIDWSTYDDEEAYNDQEEGYKKIKNISMPEMYNTLVNDNNLPTKCPRSVLNKVFIIIGNTNFKADYDMLCRTKADSNSTGICKEVPYSSMRISEAYLYDIFTTYVYPESIKPYQQRSVPSLKETLDTLWTKQFSPGIKQYWRLWFEHANKVKYTKTFINGEARKIYRYLTNIRNFLPRRWWGHGLFSKPLNLELFFQQEKDNVENFVSVSIPSPLTIALGMFLIPIIVLLARSKLSEIVLGILGFLLFLILAFASTILYYTKIMYIVIWFYLAFKDIIVNIVFSIISLFTYIALSVFLIIIHLLDFKKDRSKEWSLRLAAEHLFICKNIPSTWYIIARHHEGNKYASGFASCMLPCPSTHIPKLGVSNTVTCLPCQVKQQERRAYSNDAMIMREFKNIITNKDIEIVDGSRPYIQQHEALVCTICKYYDYLPLDNKRQKRRIRDLCNIRMQCLDKNANLQNKKCSYCHKNAKEIIIEETQEKKEQKVLPREVKVLIQWLLACFLVLMVYIVTLYFYMFIPEQKRARNQVLYEKGKAAFANKVSWFHITMYKQMLKVKNKNKLKILEEIMKKYNAFTKGNYQHFL